MQVTLPIKLPFILHGRGALEHLKNFKEKKVMIVTDKVARGIFGGRLTEYLTGKEVVIFDEVETNPKESTMNSAGDLAKSFQPELIIGMGGGSAMDTAKAAYFLYGQPAMKLAEVQYYVDYGLAKKSRLLLIPTTSGTGSEASAGCVFTHASGVKIDVISADFIPSTVIIDPELTLSMPRGLTIASGVDALAQAIESSSSIFINDFLKAFNLSAIRSLVKYLPLAAGDGANDIGVREKVHYAASMIGMAMGSVSLAIGHACGHAVGAVFPYPHGLTVGVMLPYNIEYNRVERKDIYNEILEGSFNVTGESDPAARLASLVREFLVSLGVPLTVQGLGIAKEDWDRNFEKMVKFASMDTCLRTTPRPPAEGDIAKLLQYAYEGKTVDF
ncbi:MAG: iron-containing alcohol dehydrogenase [Deltaproteobacteria bacterium]